MRRSAVRAAAVPLCGLALVAGPLIAPASAATYEIQLIGINDFHGRLTSTVADNDTDDPADDFEVGGAKQLAGAVAELSSTFAGDTYLLSAGDNIGASTFTSNVQGDEPTIEVLNEMGVTVSAVGNHEFDKGYDDVAVGGRVDALADFPYLGANVYAEGTEDPLLQEYLVEETPDGARIGYIGTVTEETAALVTPAGIAGIDFGDEAEAVNRVAAQLKDGDDANGEADIIVVLAHSGSASTDCADVALSDVPRGASALVDVIFQGHTHQAYACNTLVGAAGFTGPVVQGGQYGESFDRVTVTYDDVAGEVTATTAEVIDVVGFDQTLNAEVAATVDAAVAFALEAGSVPLGQTTTDILRAAGGDRGVESVLGNFIADVQLDQTRDGAGAQIAFMNPGGLRADFLVADQFADEACGVITLGEANVVQPFANALVTSTMTGAQIKEALEQQWQPAGADRPFLALGVSEGFFFEYDETLPAGSRITSMTLDGAPVLPATTYRVTVNEFLASGGDNFAAFAEGADPQQLGASDLEALTAYLAGSSPVTPDVEPRRAPAGGDAQPLNLSSAVCSVNQPPPTTGPAPAPAPSQGAGVGAGGTGRNPGLRVDTGVTAGANGQPWAAASLLTLLAIGAAVGYRRRGAVR